MYKFSDLVVNSGLDDYYGKKVGIPAYNFNLKTPKDKKVRLTDFRGKYVYITFGFTYCNETCPLNLERFKRLSSSFSKQGINDVEFVFISFDKVRDTPQKLNTYLSHFKLENLTGLLSGNESGLQVAKEYKNFVDYQSAKIKNNPNYQINHNGFIYLINPKGELDLIYMQQNLETEKVLSDVKKLKSKQKRKDNDARIES